MRSIILSLLALAVIGTLGACSGGDSADDTASTPTAVDRPDPHPKPEEPLVHHDLSGVYGGRYVSTARLDPKTFNGLMANESSSTTFTSGPLSDALVTYNYHTQDYEPGLAKSWEVSEDGLVWTFHWRKGVRWSDGHPLTVDDLMFSMEVVYDETIHPSVAELCKVDGEPFKYRKVGESTIEFTLPSAYGGFIDAIGSVRIMPKHKLEEAFQNGTFESAYGVDTPPGELVCSGPWMLGRYSPQEKVVLVPNPYYYRFDKDGKRLPYLDELVYLIVPDQNAELLRFQGGESDEVYFRAEDYAQMKDGEESGNYTVYDMGSEVGSNFIWVNQNPRKNPATGEPYVDPVKLKWFTDLEFRKALSHCIDRESIIRNVYYGMAEPLYGAIPSINKLWHNPNIAKFEYDLEEADRILTAAGYIDRDGDGVREDSEGNPVSFTLLVQPDNRERQGMANIVADDLKKAGINLVLAGVEFNAIISKLRESYDYDAIMLGLTGGVPPAPYTGGNVYRSDGRTHMWNPEQPEPATPWEAEIDELMNRVTRSKNREEAQKAFFEVQRIWAENQPMTYIVSRRGLIGIRNNFVGHQPSVMRPWVLWRSYALSYDPARAKRELAQKSQ